MLSMCSHSTGSDLRKLPLSMRKTKFERLLRGRPEGIFVNPFETGAIGLISSGLRVGWGWRAWSPSAPIGLIAAVGRKTGSR